MVLRWLIAMSLEIFWKEVFYKNKLKIIQYFFFYCWFLLILFNKQKTNWSDIQLQSDVTLKTAKKLLNSCTTTTPDFHSNCTLIFCYVSLGSRVGWNTLLYKYKLGDMNISFNHETIKIVIFPVHQQVFLRSNQMCSDLNLIGSRKWVKES
jgi:hypothetical protein